MEKADPLSPAPSNSTPNNLSATTDDVLHSQLQQLIEHNASMPSVDAPSHMNSNAHSRLSSPIPQQPSAAMPIYDHESPYGAAPPAPAPAYGGGYQQPGYHMEPSPYPQLPDTTTPMTPHNVYNSPATSPPTPLQGDITAAMKTRSGRTVNRTQAGTPVISGRVIKASPKPRAAGTGAGAKKAKKKKVKAGSEEAGVILAAPLSELVKDITNVQDTNIEEYVNRSPEVRQAEVRESKEGKIKRPMNAFMLYRKAYQNRTKEWKKHDNHQVISQVCGASWALEPQSMRDQYDAWAKIERANHKLAFPDYKFAPAKAKNKKLLSSRSPADDSDDSGSDLEGYNFFDQEEAAMRNTYDPDAEYRPSGMRQYAPQQPQYQHRQSPMSHHARLPYAQPHQSSFQYANPGKPRPADYGAGMGQNQYYQQTTDYARPTYPTYHHQMQPHYMAGQHQAQPIIENVYMNRTASPATGSYHSGSPVDHYGEFMGSAYPPPPPPQHHHQVAMPHQVPMPHPRVQDHHPIDPSLTGGQQSSSQFNALGIMHLDQTDALSQYTLDSSAMGNAGRRQQFDQTFHHATSDNVDDALWHHDDPAMPNLNDDSKGADRSGDWQLTTTDLHFTELDDLLNGDSPGRS